MAFQKGSKQYLKGGKNGANLKAFKYKHTLTSTMSTLLVSCEKIEKEKIRKPTPLDFNAVGAKIKAVLCP